MTTVDWNDRFGEGFQISLTDEERKYFALAAIDAAWETMTFCSKTNLWYTRVTAFFDGNTIVKVICENKRVLENGIADYNNYVEYDTNLATKDRKQLLPLTARGKPKSLSASNINAITPFGCHFSILLETGRDTVLYLSNPRANKEFPVGEREAIASIQSEADFHAFAQYYISTCREDYWDKLQAFKAAQKVTIRYKAGDIFRMEYDRTHYCYGIITGEIKRIQAMSELPKKHSLRRLMMVPIMVRCYQMITENPDLTAEDLREIPLGRMEICGDNDIIWGTQTIVDHKQLAPEDLEFHFVCTKIVSDSPHTTLFTQDMFMHDGLMPKQAYTLYLEWGFAQTRLRYHQLSEKLKLLLDDYASPHGGVAMGIDPYSAVSDDRQRQSYSYRNNLLNPENRDFLNEIFACLGLDADTTFDQFAEKYGGLSLEEIAARMTKKK